MFDLKDGKLHRAYSLHNAGKVFMLTATITDFMTQITGVLTNDKIEDYLFDFPSKAEMSDKQSSSTNISHVCFDDEVDLLDKFKSDLMEKAKDQPVLIFCNNNDFKLI